MKVFIFAGQSNLPRAIYDPNLPTGLKSWITSSPTNDCLYFHDSSVAGVSTNWTALRGHADTAFGAEHFFAYYLTPHFKAIDPDQQLAFIQVQRSATSIIGNWNAGGRVDRPNGTTPYVEAAIHTDFRTTITNALDMLSRSGDGGLGLTYELAGFIWNQGEGDMLDDNGSLGYVARFRDLIGEWVDDAAFPLDDTNLYTGGLRSGFIDPSNGVHSAANTNMFILTTRLPLIQTETKPWGDESYYDGPIGNLRVRDTLTDGNEAGENIQGLPLTSTDAWWVSCDEFSLRDSYHLEPLDRSKLSQKYAGVYMSEILDLGYDAVDFWPSMLTSEDFDRTVTDPYTNSPTYNQTIPFIFGTATVANAHTRRYPVTNAFGYPLNTQATKVWWTGTDQSWEKTDPTNTAVAHEAVFNGSTPGRLAQVICDSHSMLKALKISFDAKSLDLDGSPNGLSVSLYGATTEGVLDYTDLQQPAGQYFPADFSVALDNGESNTNVELLASMTVLDAASGQPNELASWTNLSLTAEMISPDGYSYFVLVFEGDNVQTNSGDFLGVDNVEMIPAEKSLPQILLSTASLSVPEGSTDTFNVKLTLSPTNEVPMTVNVARLSGDTDISVSSGSVLVFTTNTWDSWQTVTLGAAQDADFTNNSAVIRCSGEGMFSQDLTATEVDDELDPVYSMPWQETFENDGTHAGTLGALSAQHGWTATGAIVTNSDAQAGTQSSLLGEGEMAHSFMDGQTNLLTTLWLKPVQAEVPSSIPTNATAVFYVSTNGHVVAYSNTTPVELSGTVSNGWNKFEVESDYVSDVWTLSLNGTELFSNFAFYSTSQSAFAELRIVNESIIAGTGVDSISLSEVVVVVVSDEDSDGIPDDWETLYYGGATNANPTNICANGVNTVEEAYIAGLNPTNPASQFVLNDLTAGAESVLFWTAESGRVYTVWWASNLLDGFNEILTSNYVGGAFTDQLHGAEGEGFYKIDVELE